MKFAALFFDFFGTLVDVFKGEIYFQNLSEMAGILEVDPEKFREQWMHLLVQREQTYSSVKERILDACESLGPHPHLDQLIKTEKLRIKCLLTNLRPRPDAVPTLEWAKTAGYRLSLITNCTIELPEIWPLHPLAKYFPTPVFSCIEKVQKPNPEIYLHACKKNKVEPQDVVFIGDGENREMLGATIVGMKTILIANRDPNAFYLPTQPKTDMKVEKLSDLPDLIKNLER